MAYIGFNARNVQPAAANNFELLPRGKYLGICIESEVKTNTSRTGEYLKLTFEVIEGQFKGRKVFDQLNIRHTNPKAVEIAQGVLSQLCHAVGVLDLQDTAQLHNLPVLMQVGIEKGSNGYEDKNRIYGYENRSALKEQPQAGSLAPPFAPISAAQAKAPLTPPTWGMPPPTIKDDDVPF